MHGAETLVAPTREVIKLPDYSFAGGALRASISSIGAEPISISHETVGEMLWQAGPAWPHHAPVLFPIVGELANNAYRHGGETYHLKRHGFARTCEFSLVKATPQSVALVLVDDAKTRAVFPFRFHFEITYVIVDGAFIATYMIYNPGTDTLPVSVGAHPAFRWPITSGVAKVAHALTFAHDEPEPIRRLEHNLLMARAFPTPVVGRDLWLDPSLFESDAIVMDRPRSASVRYGVPDDSNAPAIDVAWSGFAQLGIWSKAGGDFICIEPWHGYASPTDFDAELSQKPGLAHIAPGDSQTFSMRISLEVPDGAMAGDI